MTLFVSKKTLVNVILTGEYNSMVGMEVTGSSLVILSKINKNMVSIKEAAYNYAYDGEPENYGKTFAESNGRFYRKEKAQAFIDGAIWALKQVNKITKSLIKND